MSYTIEDHSHRLAAWAASRAASVTGCRFKVHTGVALLETGGFDASFSEVDQLPDLGDIDSVHRAWREKLINAAKSHQLTLSHGIVAKLVNCYLKVRFVCARTHNDPRVQALHPPIDAVLLQELARVNFGGKAREWRTFHRERWSKFDSLTYQKAINLIRESLPTDEPLWKIEEHWAGHQGK